MSTVIGFSGIVPIGKKASFIFDSMIFIANNSKIDYTIKQKEITYDYFNSSVGNVDTTTYNAIYGEGSIGQGNTRNITLIFMPAMRFNQSYTSSFQVALAGFININEENGTSSQPIPMVSWLRKF